MKNKKLLGYPMSSMAYEAIKEHDINFFRSSVKKKDLLIALLRGVTVTLGQKHIALVKEIGIIDDVTHWPGR